MFIKDRTDPLTLPKGSKITFVVRYQGGRKPFDDLKKAKAFAKEQRSTEKGWAEVIKQIDIVLEKRS